jgi:hypothetical protein
MSRTGNLILRSVYIAAGVAVIIAAMPQSAPRTTLLFPVVLGALLIVQGVSGA